jgi:hypothetical protein
VSRTLVERVRNPRNRECGCDPDCWCRRSALGRAVRWYFPGRIVGLHHKNAELQQWKRAMAEGSLDGRVDVVGFEPCFGVADVRRAVRHYELLGFTTSYHEESYAFAHRDHLTIHLALADDGAVSPATLYIHVDDSDQLAADWRKAGLDVEGPEDTDYGKREGVHVDPDGNRLRFGSPLRGIAQEA